MWRTGWAAAIALVAAGVTPASAQEDTRPAATTAWGDTGLWFVPTGEVLRSGSVSFSVQRTERDYQQGNTNVSFWPATFAVGAGRAELFGSLQMITRIDRDTEPLLFPDADQAAGGLVNEFPAVSESWTGNHLGDLFLGGKLNLLSQERQQPLALAVRGTLKLPTADEDEGVGTGEYDGFVDLVGSGAYGAIEVAGFGGIALRGDPGDVSVSDGVRWGAGAGFPARGPLRVTAEAFGEWMFDHAVSAPPGLIVGADGSRSPATSLLVSDVTTAAGVTWQHSSGVLLGGGVNYRWGLDADDPGVGTSRSRDGYAFEFRIGFHRGVKVFVPPPPAVALAVPPAPAAPAPAPPAPAAPPPAAEPANRAPAVRAACEPCTVQPGDTARLRAEATDPDGETLSFRWTTTGGTLGDTRSAITTWRAETAPGLVTFTVTVEDGRGGRASDTVTIEVGSLVSFEDVHFDFDSFRLRADALPLLDPVVEALRQRPEMRLLIEGHTCNIGTAEYNLALGERRAASVRAYLIERGIDAARLQTISYGEDHPAHDNTTLAGRQHNRRAALVVRAADSSASD
jgi:outer membrane protein OmpA-like peptidoglycan-associated protein